MVALTAAVAAAARSLSSLLHIHRRPTALLARHHRTRRHQATHSRPHRLRRSLGEEARAGVTPIARPPGIEGSLARLRASRSATVGRWRRFIRSLFVCARPRAMSSDSNEPVLRVCLAHRVGSGCPNAGRYHELEKNYGPSAYQRLCQHCQGSFLVDRAKVRVCPEKYFTAMNKRGETLAEAPGFRDSPPLPGSPLGAFQFCLCNHLPLRKDKSGPVQGLALVLLLHEGSAPPEFLEPNYEQPAGVPAGKVRLYVDNTSRTFRLTRGTATTARRRSSNQRIPVVVPVVVGPSTSAGGAAPGSTSASPSGEYTSPSPERGGAAPAPGESDQAIFDDIPEWVSAILDHLDYLTDHPHILTISKMPAKARKKLAGELRKFADRLEEIDNRAVVDRNGSQEEQAAFEELQDEFREVLTLRSSAGGSSNPTAQHESPSSSSSDEDCLTYR